MHIDIHTAEGECQIQHAGGIAPHEKRVAVCLLHSGLQQSRFDKTPVDKEKLTGAVAPALRRGGDKPVEGKRIGRTGAGEHGSGLLSPQQGIDTGIQFPVSRGEKLLFPVPDHAYRDIRPAESAAHGGSDAGGNLVCEPVDCPGGADDLMGASSSARASDIVGAGVSAAEVKLRKSSKFWAGALALADVLRPSSREAIGELHKLGLKTALLTGDRQAAAMSIAQEAGVNVLMAEVLPVQKEAFVRQTQAEVGAVAMVGDGINDAPALKRADVGISIRVGSDIAVESADVVLMKNDITAVASAIRLSRAVVANIKENLFWAFFYNCLGIPIAAGLFYPLWGWHLTPALASLAMSCSSLFVVGNALRLTRFQDKAQKVSLDSNLTVEGQALGALRIAHLKPEFLADIRTEGENDQNTRGAELFSEAERIDMQKTIKINGMMCAHCEAHVRKALEALEGVEKAEVSHEKGEAVVTLGSNVDDAVLKAAVVEAGYEVLQVL